MDVAGPLIAEHTNCVGIGYAPLVVLLHCLLPHFLFVVFVVLVDLAIILRLTI